MKSVKEINLNKIKKEYKITELEIKERDAVVELEEIYTVNWGYKDEFEILEGENYKIEEEEEEIQPPDNQGHNYHYIYRKKIKVGDGGYVLIRCSEEVGSWRKREKHLLIYSPDLELKTDRSEITKNYKKKEKEFFSDLKRISEIKTINNAEKQEIREKIVSELNKWRLQFLKKYQDNLEIVVEEDDYYGVNCKIYNVVSDDGELLFWVRDIPEASRPQDKISQSYAELADFIYATFF